MEANVKAKETLGAKIAKATITKEQFMELSANKELAEKMWELLKEPEMKTTMAIAIARREVKK